MASEDWKTRITKISAVSRVPEGGACLVWIYPADSEMGKRLKLEKEELTIGRGSDVDITIDRDSVSRRHAKIVQTGNQYAVIDLGSTNGTYVNDVKVTEAVLVDGDVVRVGKTPVVFKSHRLER